MFYCGKVAGTSSVALVESMDYVEMDRHIPGFNNALTPEEMRFVESIAEEFEGRNS